MKCTLHVAGGYLRDTLPATPVSFDSDPNIGIPHAGRFLSLDKKIDQGQRLQGLCHGAHELSMDNCTTISSLVRCALVFTTTNRLSICPDGYESANLEAPERN